MVVKAPLNVILPKSASMIIAKIITVKTAAPVPATLPRLWSILLLPRHTNSKHYHSQEHRRHNVRLDCGRQT